MTWEWQAWRCFGDVQETFEEKGWRYERGNGYGDNAVMPLLARSGDLFISFFNRDPGTGECWFELRDGTRDLLVFIRGSHNVPTPEQAATLISVHGVPAARFPMPRHRPVYELPVAPMVPIAKAR